MNKHNILMETADSKLCDDKLIILCREHKDS